MNLKQNLNDAQQKAVNAFLGPVMILAGAGSGKTGVLVHRIANMIQNNIAAENILCLTYTNKAASEMKNRIQLLLSGNVTNKKPLVSTFHALSCRLLKRYMQFLCTLLGYEGYSNQFSIISNPDKKNIFFEIARNLNYDIEEFYDKDIVSKISLAKNKGISYQEYAQNNNKDKLASIVYSEYQTFLQNQNALDFDDLLFFCWVLLNNFPHLLQKVQANYRYIMVDEYQDTNLIQYKILSLLAGKKQNLCVVGDDDQSIYSFRGANMHNIHYFQKDFPNAQTIFLEENYRSTKIILDAASAVIKNNNNRLFAKTVWSRLKEGEKIKAIEADNPFDEAEKVIEQILLNRFRYTTLYKDHVVLFRTNSQSKPFEKLLAAKGIGYYTSNKVDFYDRKEIRDALAFLKISAYPQDDLSLLRLITLPYLKTPSIFIQKLKDYSTANKVSFYVGLKWLLNNNERNTKNNLWKHKLQHLLSVLESYCGCVQGKDMTKIFREYLNKALYFDYLSAQAEDMKLIERRIDSLENLMTILETYAKKSNHCTVENFLMRLYLSLTTQKEQELFQENVVHLLTIHAAKGLEFSHVYVVGLEEGLLPYYDDREDDNVKDNSTKKTDDLLLDVDEERRLCYVAFTRAKKTLFLSLCRERKFYSETLAKEPSRFLAEIPDGLIDRTYGSYFLQSLDKKKASGEDYTKLAFKGIASIRGMK